MSSLEGNRVILKPLKGFIPFDSAVLLLGLCHRSTVVVHMKTMHKNVSRVYVRGS